MGEHDQAEIKPSRWRERVSNSQLQILALPNPPAAAAEARLPNSQLI